MTLGHGLAMAIIGCTITFIGFFIAFLIINHNKKKEKEKLNKQNEHRPHNYYGDDTV